MGPTKRNLCRCPHAPPHLPRSFLCTTISSGMFITAMAANPLAVNLASETLGYTISWGEGVWGGVVCVWGGGGVGGGGALWKAINW